MTTTNATKVASRDQNDDVDDTTDPAARPTRLILGAEEKLNILARYEACKPGQKGAFARRDGVYLSQLNEHACILGLKGGYAWLERSSGVGSVRESKKICPVESDPSGGVGMVRGKLRGILCERLK